MSSGVPSSRAGPPSPTPRIAYQSFRRLFSGERWEQLRARGANVQRPLWASTSTKDPAYPDTLYVDALIGPDTVNTMPDATLAAARERATATRTPDSDPEEALATMDQIRAAGVDVDDSQVMKLNRKAANRISAGPQLDIVRGAGHLFDEPGALEQVAQLTGDWFARQLPVAGASR
jgi:hypothetical protein